MATSSHPLPQIPPVPPTHFYQQQQPQHPNAPQGPDGHPKPGPRNRTFSFRSDKSHKSTDLVETSAEKEAHRLHSKADPTLAMSEDEPGVVAATVKSSLAPLRNMRHKDMHGNVIDDPDRSNPTRSRWERPLDTIRSFEAAIDDTDSVANWDRRSSYFAPSNATRHNSFGGRYQRDSYYSTRGGQPSDRRYGGWSESHGDPHGAQGYNAYSNVPRTRYSRMASEPQFNSHRQLEQHNIYPVPMNHRSYETVASGTGSGTSGEHAGYQTDPTSSDNSSIERVQSPPKRQPEPINDYGIGFSQSSNYQAPSFTVGVHNGGTATPPSGYQASTSNSTPQAHEPPPPAVPRKQSTILRKPTRAPSTASEAPERPGMGDKRKSWFARRFSKHS